jgi:hypothetical protein
MALLSILWSESVGVVVAQLKRPGGSGFAEGVFACRSQDGYNESVGRITAVGKGRHSVGSAVGYTPPDDFKASEK